VLAQHGRLSGTAQAAGDDGETVAGRRAGAFIEASYEFTLSTVASRGPLLSVGVGRVLGVCGEAGGIGLAEKVADISNVFTPFCVGERDGPIARLRAVIVGGRILEIGGPAAQPGEQVPWGAIRFVWGRGVAGG
jgi:hypothetical protein